MRSQCFLHLFRVASRRKDRGELGRDPFAMVTHPTNLRLGFQPEVHVNVKEEKRRPSPGIPKPCGVGGGDSAAFQRTPEDLRTEKQGMSYTCLTHGSPTILHIHLRNLAHHKTYGIYTIVTTRNLQTNEITFGMLSCF